MITLANLADTLKSLGFSAKGETFSKTVGTARLMVRLHSDEIVYPEDQGLVINERQTCNLKSPENFVVLECVVRLLQKGYKPQHIELEPRWQLGRGSSGGRADILVKDNHGKPLLLIECKAKVQKLERQMADAQAVIAAAPARKQAILQKYL